jgi:hypothetical protein
MKIENNNFQQSDNYMEKWHDLHNFKFSHVKEESIVGRAIFMNMCQSVCQMIDQANSSNLILSVSMPTRYMYQMQCSNVYCVCGASG